MAFVSWQALKKVNHRLLALKEDLKAYFHKLTLGKAIYRDSPIIACLPRTMINRQSLLFNPKI